MSHKRTAEAAELAAQSSSSTAAVASAAPRSDNIESGFERMIRKLQETNMKMFAREVVAATAVCTASSPAAPSASSPASAPSASAPSASATPKNYSALLRYMRDRRADSRSGAKYFDSVEAADAEWPTLLDVAAADAEQFDAETAARVATALEGWVIAFDRRDIARSIADAAEAALEKTTAKIQRMVDAFTEASQRAADKYIDALDAVHSLQSDKIQRCEEAIGTTTSPALEAAAQVLTAKLSALRSQSAAVIAAEKEAAAVPPIASPAVAADASEIRALGRLLRTREHCDALNHVIDAQLHLLLAYRVTLTPDQWAEMQPHEQQILDAYKPLDALEAAVEQTMRAVLEAEAVVAAGSGVPTHAAAASAASVGSSSGASAMGE
jgi:hypothetical protein